MEKKIILDTNFLLVPFQFGVDIFAEIERICQFNYKLYVLERSIDELKKINRPYAKAALDLIRAKRIDKIQTEEGNVDDLLVKEDAIVATQDKELIRRLKKTGKTVIQLRQKKYLIIK